MEKFNVLKQRAWVLLGAGLGVLALNGCSVNEGQTEAPTPQEIQRDGQFIELEQPDGNTMDCFLYSEKGEGYQRAYSWVVLDCDWENFQR